VRDHSCLSCGRETDRDASAAWNTLSRGLEDVGSLRTDVVVTALPTDTNWVSIKRVVEAGTPAL